MKKGFPNKILGLFPYGWESRGDVSSTYIGNDTYQFSSHSFCRTQAKIGKENGEIFLYCPKCLVKLVDTPPTKP